MPTITTSKVGAVIDALVTAFKASATLADPIVVLDGPGAEPEGWTDIVYVGYDGDLNGSFESVLINHTWAYLGNTSQFEDLEVRCAVRAWSGDITAKPVRDRAILLLGAVETVIRTDPTLTLGGATIAELIIGTMYQTPFAGGIECRIPFDIRVQAFLPSS